MKFKYARIKTFTEEGSVGDGLTEGKYYEIFELDSNNCGFIIFDDYHNDIYCRVNGCAFLGGGDWELFAELPE